MYNEREITIFCCFWRLRCLCYHIRWDSVDDFGDAEFTDSVTEIKRWCTVYNPRTTRRSAKVSSMLSHSRRR